MKPWAEGPLELLKHGKVHLDLNTDFDYRIAMISIDNAVELMIKTYLSLPRRVTGITGLSRKRQNEAFESFPSLLDALEEFASEKIQISGFDLSDIEWYHRLRNQLYHSGNGITIEGVRVEAYYEIASILFWSLFDETVEIEPHEPTSEIGSFILRWSELEQSLFKLQAIHNIPENAHYLFIIESLQDLKVIPDGTIEDFAALRKLRNSLIHSSAKPNTTDLQKARKNLKHLLRLLKNAIKNA